MNTQSYSRVFLAATLIFLLQCSPGGFKSEPASSSDVPVGSQSPVDQTPADNNAQRRAELFQSINNATFSGVVSTGLLSDPTVPSIDFDRSAGAYLLRVPMTSFSVLTNFDMSFKEYPGMRLYLEYISSKPFITLFVPVKYVLRNVTEVPAKLPNGDRVPLFPAGEPPSKGILLTPNKDKKVYLYLSAEAFGLFAETSFDPSDLGGIMLKDLIFTIRNKENNKALGYLTIIPKVNDFKGGFFVSHRIDPKLGKILDEYYIY